MGEKLNVAFLFGAGAEGKDNFEISTGFEFIKAVINTEKESANSKYLVGLSNVFKKREKDFQNVTYRRDTVDFYNAALEQYVIRAATEDKAFYEKNRPIISKLLTVHDLKLIDPTYNSSSDEKKSDDCNVDKSEILGIWKTCINSGLGQLTGDKEAIEFIKKLFKADETTIDYNIGLGGILDKYFYSVVDPAKYGPGRFARLINFYWICYFTIVLDILKYMKDNCKNTEWIDDYYKDKKLDAEKIVSNIAAFTKNLYKTEIHNTESTYYEIIKRKLQKTSNIIECKGIITTNYYPFCKILNNDAIFLNGELKYFEIPKTMEVIDASEDSIIPENTLFFPFIFGQTMVKPIINKIQITAFSNFSSVLDNSDCLVILGYGINDDDSHINTFIREAAKQGKKILFVDNKEESQTDITNKLNANDNLLYIKVNYGDNEEVVNKIFKKLESVRQDKVEKNNLLSQENEAICSKEELK